MSSQPNDADQRPPAAASAGATTLPLLLLLVVGLVAAVATRVPGSSASPKVRPAVVLRQSSLPAGPSQPFPGEAYRALQVVSVTAPSAGSSSARLVLWVRAGLGRPWRPVGEPVRVDLGDDGLTAHPREGKSATPLGSFTLTRAFGRAPNAGHDVALHYRRLQPGDGWTSKPGARYNTFNHNSDEMYRGRNGWMRAAVLINYNTADPRQGAGSGFFLHVGDGRPTNGCIGVPLRAMLHLLTWLRPDEHPRLVTGITHG